MGFLSSLFGFSQNNNLIELTSNQDVEDGWNDLIFTITEKEKLENGFWSLTFTTFPLNKEKAVLEKWEISF